MKLAAAAERVRAGDSLSRAEAGAVFSGALVGGFDAALLTDLLRGLATRGETFVEIAGGADALRGAMVPFRHDHPDAIDTCGTGGDGRGTFNISTAAAIVAAAAGAKVIKHGNRSQSSLCGSADVLEAAGIPLEISPESARIVLDRVGITFLFAPAYHPALRHAAPVRRAIGSRTIFNFLGPLANPGGVKRQLIGVPEERRVREIAAALAELGHERGYVVHGAGGADELTLAGRNYVEPIGNAPRERFDAEPLGLARAEVGALVGGDTGENLRLLRSVLDGQPSAHLDAVILNTAAALVVAGIAESALEGARQAGEAVASGRAREKLTHWVEAARERAS